MSDLAEILVPIAIRTLADLIAAANKAKEFDQTTAQQDVAIMDASALHLKAVEEASAKGN